MPRHYVRLFLTLSLSLTITAVALALLGRPVRAADQCVAPSGAGGCQATIQTAVNAAGSGDTIRVVAGTYTENISINKGVILLGGFDDTSLTSRTPRSSIIRGTGNGSVINISNSGPVIVEGFTITGGDATVNGGIGGGMAIFDSPVTIRNNLIEGNVGSRASGVSAQGGAIFGQGSSDIIIEDNTIQNNIGNAAGGKAVGGGIELENVTAVTLTNNSILQNTAVISGARGKGGGISADNVQRLVLRSNRVMSNTALVTGFSTDSPQNVNAQGGGIAVNGADDGNDLLLLEDNIIVGNTAVQTATVSGNDASGSSEGGGVWVSGISSTQIISNEVRANMAADSLSVSGSSGWGGSSSGGGIYITNSDGVTLIDNVIQDNIATDEHTVSEVVAGNDGGGLSLQNVKNSVINDNLIAGNTAVVTGNFTNNSAENYFVSGGGLGVGCWNRINCWLSIKNNQIINNQAAKIVTSSGTGATSHIDGGGLNLGSISTTLVMSNEVRGNISVDTLSLNGNGGWGGRPSGGGLSIFNNDSLVFSNNKIENNIVARRQFINEVGSNSEGGGMTIGGVKTGTINNNTISKNIAVITGSLFSNTGQNYFPSGGGASVGCNNISDCQISFVNNEILDNVTAHVISVTGTNANGGSGGGGIQMSRSTILLQSNVISGNTGNLTDYGFGGGINANGAVITMTENRVLGNGFSSLLNDGSGSIQVDSTTLESVNDVIARNQDGVSSVNSSAVTLLNNTLYNNGFTGASVGNNSTLNVTNTIIYSHEAGLRKNDASSTLIGDYNLLSNTTNYAGGASGGSNDVLNQNPLLVDVNSDDYNLSSGSPAIDQGTNSDCPAIDHLNTTRPVDGDADGTATCDIGAFEAFPALTISKQGPAIAKATTPISYVLTITNSGNAAAGNLLITDAIPLNAHYVSGGTPVGQVVSWVVASLAGGDQTLERTFVVTASRSITNSDYRVQAAGGFSAQGNTVIETSVPLIYLPIVLK